MATVLVYSYEPNYPSAEGLFLTHTPDTDGYYRGYVPRDPRRRLIEVRWEVHEVGRHTLSGYAVYIAGVQLQILCPTLTDAEDEATAYIQHHK